MQANISFVPTRREVHILQNLDAKHFSYLEMMPDTLPGLILSNSFSSFSRGAPSTEI